MNKNNDIKFSSLAFSGYILDINRRELSRQGKQIDLQPRVFDLLVYLVNHHERVVGKDELQDAVWPGMVITETALTRAVMKMRKAVGDDASKQTVIKTIHGHGYRFIAELSPVSSERDDSRPGTEVEPSSIEISMAAGQKYHRKWPWLFMAALVVLIAVVLGWRQFRTDLSVEGVIRVAVLPVQNGTEDPDLVWTQLGLMSFASQLIEADGELATVSDGSIISLADSFDWDGSLDTSQNADFFDRIHRVFAASHILSMRLVKDGSLLRMNYALLDKHNRKSEGTMVAEEATELAKGVVQSVYGLILKKSRLGSDFPLVSSDPFNNEAFARGMSLSLEGRCAEAVQFFRVIVEQEPSLSVPQLELAACLRILGEAEEAESLLLSLIDEQSALGSSRLLAQSLMVLGVLYNRTGRLEEAEVTHNRALAVSREIGDFDFNARILQNLSIVAKNVSNLKKSAELLDLALLEYERAGRETLPGQIYSAKANLKMEQGELVEAEEFLKQALQAFQEIGDRRNVAMMLNNTGYLRWNQGRFEEAENYIRQSLTIRTEIEDRVGVGRNYGFLAGLYTASGNLEGAKTAAMRASEVARETNDRLFEGTSQSQLGDIAKAMGDYINARDYYLDGRVIFDDINDRMRVLQSDLKLASLNIATGSYPQAGDTAREVMQEAKERDLLLPEVEAMELLGDLALAQGDLVLASHEFARALDRARESSWSGKQNDLMIKQADVLLDQLDLEAASPLIGALSRQEETAQSLEVQARFSYQMGDFQSAVEHMEKAQTLAGESWTDEQELKLTVYKEKANAVG